MKVWAIPGSDGTTLYVVDCPACGYGHPFRVGQSLSGKPTWSFNGDFERPTFEPSMLCMPDGPKRCHSFVRNGTIQFLPDSWHGRSDTVPLPDVEN